MAHTPGPWEVAMPGDVDEHYGVLDGFGHTASVYGYPDEAAVALANARLMAAAPELLAALRGVLYWADCECQRLAEDTPANDDPPMCDYCVAKLVIAKAEGRGE